MNVLVTGGCGFLGRNLIERLLQDGHAVTCVDRFLADWVDCRRVRFVLEDVSSAAGLERVVEGHDALVHLACSSLPQTSVDDPQRDVMANVGGTIRLLDAVRAVGGMRFLFISSGGTVYGLPQEIPIPETHPTNPLCPYGIAKLAVEKYVGMYRMLHGLSTCSLRLANPYGRYQRVQSVQGVIPVFIYRILRGESIDIWGDGSVRRDFVYVDDAVDAMVRAVVERDGTGELNVGSGRSHSLLEIVREIERQTGRKAALRYLPSRSFDVPENALLIERARQMLGWMPRMPLDIGLERTIEWVRKEYGS